MTVAEREAVVLVVVGTEGLAMVAEGLAEGKQEEEALEVVAMVVVAGAEVELEAAAVGAVGKDEGSKAAKETVDGAVVVAEMALVHSVEEEALATGEGVVAAVGIEGALLAAVGAPRVEEGREGEEGEEEVALEEGEMVAGKLVAVEREAVAMVEEGLAEVVAEAEALEAVAMGAEAAVEVDAVVAARALVGREKASTGAEDWVGVAEMTVVVEA